MFAANLMIAVLLGITSTAALAQGTAKVGDPPATPPSQVIGDDAASRDYLRAARVALVAGKSGEARQALELAETRALGRPRTAGADNAPNTSLYLARIADARRALGKGDSRYAISLIDVALLH